MAFTGPLQLTLISYIKNGLKDLNLPGNFLIANSQLVVGS